MDKLLVKIENDSDFMNIVGDILENKMVQQMKNYRQHYETTCFEHCLIASYFCYMYCKKHNLDYISCARAAMVHDLFLYDWRKRINGRKGLHAFTHPFTAYENASKLFNLNAKEKDIITPEFKAAGNKIVKFEISKDQYDKPVYDEIMKLYDEIHEMIQNGVIISAYAVEGKGVIPAVSKMAFGNKIGVSISGRIPGADLFAPGFGDIIAEVPADRLDDITSSYVLIGETNDKEVFEYGYDSIPMDEAIKVWEKPLEKVFPTRSHKDTSLLDTPIYDKGSVYVCKNKVAKPTVFIPVFPGTNCEYDSAKAFEKAGANVITKVFKNLTPEDIRDSVKIFEESIAQSQIIMFPGGFSAGDEPDGSAKFFATAFRNAKIEEAVHKLLNERDGLALGICNGFQALIKLGLVPNGKITGQDVNAPTLTYNTINRHISKMVYTKVVSNKSPWLQNAELGGVYVNPASHGEGRFVAPEECIKELFANGQVATQYVNQQGQPTMDEEWNVNGSYYAIEGITSPDGRCFGKMAHIERKGRSVATNIYGEQDLKVFESGVNYFK